MSNYSPSTIARIGDIKNGLLVETSKEISYLSWGVGVQAYPFTVYNRINIHALWLEVGATALVGVGALLLFNFISTIPSIGVQPMSTVCSTIHGFVRGRRVTMGGVSIATVVNVDGTAGISFAPSGNGTIVGVAPSAAVPQSVGKIGVLTSVAVLTAGTGQFSLLYTPVDDGAYAEALL